MKRMTWEETFKWGKAKAYHPAEYTRAQLMPMMPSSMVLALLIADVRREAFEVGFELGKSTPARDSDL